MKIITSYATHLLTIVRTIAVLACAFVIIACGGAATSSGSSGTSNGMTLTLTDASGNAVSNMAVGTNYTLTATITQATGVAVSNVVVTFVAGSSASLSPTSGTALTNSVGVATMVIVPTTAGAATASASASVIKTTTTQATATTAATTSTSTLSVSGTRTYSVSSSSSSSSSSSLALTFLDSGGTAVNTMNIGTNYTLKATATDSSGTPINNTIITFTPSSSGSLIPSTGTALTNGNGVASVTFVPGTAGANTASASFTSGGSTISKSINFSIAPTPTTTLGTLTPASTYISSAATTTLTINTYVSQALTSGVTVLFSASCGQITTTNPASSNSSGVATATYSATSSTGTLCSGAVTVTATAGSATSNATITVGAPVITLNNITASPSSISSGGNSSIGLAVKANGNYPVSTVNVSFSATCGQVSPSVVSSNGNTSGNNITTTYSSVKSDGTLCAGSDTITASSSGATTSVTVTIAAPTTGSISFMSASPTQIFLSNSGAGTTSTLSFKALYSNGSVAPSASVKFTLTGNPGGVTFGVATNTAAYTVVTDSSGVATVQVYAGNVAGSVTIQADWMNTTVTPQTVIATTTSNGLVVASGPPRQTSFTLTATKYNMDAAEYDGDTTTITARLADANGNPVPDGTVINFVSNGGQINRSCSTSTANSGGTNASGFSQCSVVLMGQNPRTTNGRVAVLAYAEGVKKFTDANGNGTYDTGETLNDIGDAYRDDNEDGQWSSGEFIVSRGGSSACPANSLANGSTGGDLTGGISNTGYGGSVPAKGSTCDGKLATTVRRQIALFFSSSNATATITSGALSSTATAPTQLQFYLSGATNSTLLPLPSGTTVSVSVVDTAANPTTGCTASDLFPTSVGNATYTGTSPTENVAQTNYKHSVTLTGTAANGSAAAVVCKNKQLKITASTSVSGTTTTIYRTIP